MATLSSASCTGGPGRRSQLPKSQFLPLLFFFFLQAYIQSLAKCHTLRVLGFKEGTCIKCRTLVLIYRNPKYQQIYLIGMHSSVPSRKACWASESVPLRTVCDCCAHCCSTQFSPFSFSFSLFCCYGSRGGTPGPVQMTI